MPNKSPDLPTNPEAGDPLQRRVVDAKSNTVQYLIGYRSITLVPVKNPQNIRPYPGTQRFSVDEGAAGYSNIKIHAEDIYICAGSVFDFAGKKVTITARRIYAVNHEDSASTEIQFNCNGAAGTDENDKAQTGGSGTEAYRPGHPGPGEEGKPGKGNSSTAGAGGNVLIFAELHCLAEKSISFSVNCLGGKGGQGGTGGDGGVGGNGYWSTDGVSPWYIGNDNWKIQPNLNGGSGGNGGPGGAGGRGGAGGCIIDLTSPNASKDSQTKLQSNISDSSVHGGLQGSGGSGGAGGAGGNQGCYFRKVWLGSNIDLWGIKGSSGPHGNSGEPGPLGTGGILYGPSKHKNILPLPDVIKAMSISPVQIAMVFQRLIFEFQLIYATQPFDFRGHKHLQFLDEHKQRFKETSDWLGTYIGLLKSAKVAGDDAFLGTMGIHDSRAQSWFKDDFIRLWNAQEEARKQLIESYTIFLTTTSPGRTVDFDNHSFYYIARPNLALADLKKSIEDLEILEANKAKFFSAITTIESAKANVSTAIGSLESTLKDFQSTKSQICDSLDAQYQVVDNARQEVRAGKVLTVEAINHFWGSVKHKFTCNDLNEVISAIGNVLLFAHGPLGVVFKVGAALSVAAATSKVTLGNSQIDTAEGAIKADALQGQVYLLEANLADDVLQANITEKNSQIRSLSVGDQKFVNQIITERTEFRKLCNRYFSHPDLDSDTRAKMAHAKNVFDDFVNTCQTFHTAVIKYNELAVSLATLLSNNRLAQTTLATMKSHNFEPTLPWLDLMYAFYNQVYAFQKSRVIRILFQAVRCCNGAFLRRSSLLDDFIQLGCYQNITSGELHAACTSRLADDVEKHLATWNEFEPDFIDGHSKSFFTKDNNYLLNKLKTKRRFAFYINPENAVEKYNFSAKWFDIRLTDIRVYLIGATNTQASTENPNSQEIVVAITLGNQFTVVDEDIKSQYSFEVPEKTRTFAYNYSPGKNHYRQTSKPASTLLQNFNFAMAAEDKANFTQPMQSPLCKYTIAIGKEVDVSNVSELRMEFGLRVRTRKS
ncbi:hypothetical protein DFH27DRAFT_245828 [Peziza echinospora]|nr:hypothetical protein DFH27DRAFT_245828 [Peziza echinospora]